VSKQAIHAEEQMSMFKGAKTEEDKMRIISQWVAKSGPFALAGMSVAGNAPLTWDIELAGAGHKDFPGRATRLEMEEKSHMYSDAMAKSPELAATYIVGITHYLKELNTRLLNVADLSMYTDLPIELRNQQIKQIRHFISEFERIRTIGMQAEIAASAADSKQAAAQAGKPADGKAHAGAEHPGGAAHAGPPDPQAKELAAIRVELAGLDQAIVRDHQFVMTASMAISHARGSVIRRNSPKIEEARQSSRDQFNSAATLDVQQAAFGEEIRKGQILFTSSKDNLGAGRALVPPTKQKADLLASMVDLLKMSASDLKPVTTELGTAKYAAFWETIPGEIGSADNDPDY
jgi:hypothetical protein